MNKNAKNNLRLTFSTFVIASWIGLLGLFIAFPILFQIRFLATTLVVAGVPAIIAVIYILMLANSAKDTNHAMTWFFGLSSMEKSQNRVYSWLVGMYEFSIAYIVLLFIGSFVNTLIGRGNDINYPILVSGMAALFILGAIRTVRFIIRNKE